MSDQLSRIFSSAEALQSAESAEQLSVVVEEVYNKSVMEPSFSELYADLVLVLRARSPSFPYPDGSQKPADFQRGMVWKCQLEFEK